MTNTEIENITKPVAHLRQKLNLLPGAFVMHGDKVFRISEVMDFESLIAVDLETGRSRPLRIGELSPFTDCSTEIKGISAKDIDEIGDTDWETAEKRFAIIKPLLEGRCSRQEIKERAKEFEQNVSTIYRWLARYRSIGVVAALIPLKRGWHPGKGRISKYVEEVIQEVIKDVYLTPQRPSVQKVIIEVKIRCYNKGITAPHPNTVRNRILALNEKQVLSGRGFKEKAKNKFLPAAGQFPNADYPLAVVQIDHTPVDIILVDDKHRKPIGRPWITLAIDVFSRMVVGYYLSFDPPSGTSVAMCVAHAMLPKEEWLVLHGVEAKWDVWGVMDKIHVDNGAEFRAENFRQSCLMHNITLEFRPIKVPRYGGHIERLLGTFARDIHELPGTTFSSIKDREGYDSEKHAVMTKTEFEEWFVDLVCNVYHQRKHEGIGMPPVKKWEIGIFGNNEIFGRGLPPRPANRHSLLLDFLPSFRRSIQRYGVSIDGPNYYADVLRPWINAPDPDDPTSKRKFVFRRDPRDISSIWFYDPDDKQYYNIPFANQALPVMSIWEYQQAKKLAKESGMNSLNDHQILQAITALREKVEASTEKTKKARRQSQRRREHQKMTSAGNPLSLKTETTKEQQFTTVAHLTDLLEDIKPFEDIA
jgi:putative transposase